MSRHVQSLSANSQLRAEFYGESIEAAATSSSAVDIDDRVDSRLVDQKTTLMGDEGEHSEREVR